MRASCQPASGAPLSRPEQGRGLMRLRVGLLGGGSWGTTVASVVSRNAPITLWARDAATVDGINRLHENHKYLPGIKLPPALRARSEEHTSELQSLMRISYAVFGLKKKNTR